MSRKKIISLLSAPVVLIMLFFALKFGYINPMIKALDIHIIGGSFITNTNRYVIKVGDKLPISLGDYVVVPEFSKKPKLEIVCLDNKGVIYVKDNILYANKEGLSTIGIINKNRLLRKVNIMVVDPKINNMEIKFSKDIKYVGDKAKIKSFVEIDKYKKLSGAYKLNYSSTNPNVLKVSGDEIEAIGVGEAKLISKYGRKEVQTSFEVYPKVDSLIAENEYELEVGQSKFISPKIKTYPEDKKTIIKYNVADEMLDDRFDKNTRKSYTESGLRTIKGVEIDEKGNIKANIPGNYKLLISSGEKSFESTIHVVKKSFENIKVENLQYFSEVKNGKINIELGWDYDDSVRLYNIYLKTNKDIDFKKYDKLSINKNSVGAGNRISQNITLDLKDKNIRDFQFYVQGESGDKQTKKSDILFIDPSSSNEFQKIQINNPRYFIKDDNVEIFWSEEKDAVSYRVYGKRRGFKENNYVLLAKNINGSNVIIKLPKGESKKTSNYDYYIVAINKNGQISDFSKAAVKLKS